MVFVYVSTCVADIYRAGRALSPPPGKKVRVICNLHAVDVLINNSIHELMHRSTFSRERVRPLRSCMRATHRSPADTFECRSNRPLCGMHTHASFALSFVCACAPIGIANPLRYVSFDMRLGFVRN